MAQPSTRSRQLGRAVGLVAAARHTGDCGAPARGASRRRRAGRPARARAGAAGERVRGAGRAGGPRAGPDPARGALTMARRTAHVAKWYIEFDAPIHDQLVRLAAGHADASAALAALDADQRARWG